MSKSPIGTATLKCLLRNKRLSFSKFSQKPVSDGPSLIWQHAVAQLEPAISGDHAERFSGFEHPTKFQFALELAGFAKSFSKTLGHQRIVRAIALPPKVENIIVVIAEGAHIERWHLLDRTQRPGQKSRNLQCSSDLCDVAGCSHGPAVTTIAYQRRINVGARAHQNELAVQEIIFGQAFYRDEIRRRHRPQQVFP